MIFVLAIGSSLFAYTFEKRAQTSINQLNQHFIQKELVERLYQNARDRSIILIKLVSSNDPFEREDLRISLYSKAEEIILSFEKYQQFNTTDDERRLLNQLLEVTTKNRDLQNQVVAKAANEQPQHALEHLVNETLPIQEQVISIFQTLYNKKTEQLIASRQAVNSDIEMIKRLWIFTLVSLFIVLGGVSVATLRKLKRAHIIQENFQSELEQKVLKRTKEIVLDSAILQNIHEAIAVTTEKGELIKTNAQFNQLIEQQSLTSELYIWNILPKLFKRIDTDRIFADVTKSGAARLEGSLLTEAKRHFLIDVHQIEDVRLDHSYLSFVFTDVTHLKQTQTELEKIANYDLVTQLPNRHLFQQTLNHWLQKDRAFSLFFLDLDNFKWVNDTQGHAAGDKILQKVARIIESHLPKSRPTLVARLGGDEFAILHFERDEFKLARLANDLIDDIKDQYQAVNPSQTLGCSIGIALYPKDGHTPEDLMRHADFAMYKAKEQGKNAYCLFSDKMNEHIHYLYETEINLHQALLNKEFFLAYQPQYELNGLKIIGAEALIRWNQNDRLIPPGEFIPLAEKFGLIQSIGSFVLQTALEQFSQWKTAQQPIERIAINVSSAQLNGRGFVQEVKAQLEKNKLLPDQVDLEITESLLMEHLNEDNAELNELQQKGLQISIDDFGTGYSSLAYIKHLNVDRIKIDQSFVRDLEYNAESYSIVAAIITMGHSLGMKVLAEGIETQQQLHILQELGCDEGQGYLLSKPMTADQICFDTLKIINP